MLKKSTLKDIFLDSEFLFNFSHIRCKNHFPVTKESRVQFSDMALGNIMLNVERVKIEKQENWEEWCELIPPLNFPKKWNVTIIPPFCGAMVRFRIQTPKMNQNDMVSVYLDVDNSLGCWSGPYWEVYPFDEDVVRCDMSDTGQLMKNISKSVKQLEKINKKNSVAP